MEEAAVECRGGYEGVSTRGEDAAYNACDNGCINGVSLHSDCVPTQNHSTPNPMYRKDT
jgi:hypothetical protein